MSGKSTDKRNCSIELFLTKDELICVKEAAEDAHLETQEYARLMVLAAAGMGGVVEHLQRACQASIVAEVASGHIEEDEREPLTDITGCDV